ncbi:MAG TPA: hypothetical protein VHS96_18950 [Bacteroidia bacterium]|nr:hypothetical protein [Bacteroidia bacterium]
MVEFYLPNLLQNRASEAINYNFANNGTVRCLFSACSTTVDAGGEYVPSSHPEANPNSHGFFFPSVTSSSELGSNYGKFISDAGEKYLWLQLNEDADLLLYQSNSLNFGGGVPVVTKTGSPITGANIADATLRVINGTGGGIIIIGILDIAGDDDYA